MDEYIKKQDVIDLIMSQPVDAHYPSWYADLVNKISVADVVPVKHGRWLYKHRHRGGFRTYAGYDEFGEKHEFINRYFLRHYLHRPSLHRSWGSS